MKFSEKLKLLRKELNLSQEQLAEYLEVSRQTISKYETDQGFPDAKRLYILCLLYNVDIDYFLVDRIFDYAGVELTERDVENIFMVLEKYTGVKKTDIIGKFGGFATVEARGIIAWLSSCQLQTRIPNIDFPISSINIHTVERRFATDIAFRQKVQAIIDELHVRLERPVPATCKKLSERYSLDLL